MILRKQELLKAVKEQKNKIRNDMKTRLKKLDLLYLMLKKIPDEILKTSTVMFDETLHIKTEELDEINKYLVKLKEEGLKVEIATIGELSIKYKIIQENTYIDLKTSQKLIKKGEEK